MSRPTLLVTLVTLFTLASCSSKETRSEPEGDAAAAREGGASAQAETPENPAFPPAEELLARAVEASGGAAKISEVHTYRSESEISIVGQAIRGQMKLWWKDGDFYTVQEIPGIGTIEAGKLGALVWSRDPITGLRELEGVEAEQHHWASSFLLPADWKAHFERAETVGERSIDGHQVYDVALTSASGAQMQISIDHASGLPIEQKLDQVSALGNAPVVTRLEDYRDVGGIKVAYKQVTDTSVAKALQQTTSLELNVDVDSSKFGLPNRGEDVVDGAALKKPTAMPFADDGKPGRPVPAER